MRHLYASDRIKTVRIDRVTDVAKVHKVPGHSTVKIYPTQGGKASLYSTNTPQYIGDQDTDLNSIINSNHARWDLWGESGVSDQIIHQSATPVETLCLLVESGEWVIEVTFKE